MAEERRETVVVEGDNKHSSSYGWLVALVVIIVLFILFFAFGGFSMFGGDTNTTETPSVNAPDTINVQPSQ